MRLPFLKMHGLGNDFVVIDNLTAQRRPEAAHVTPELARKIGDRHFGVGFDQLLWLKPAQDAKAAHAKMDILNTDGSTAEMCGNGIRAVALFLHDHGGQPGLKEYRIETGAGLLTVRISKDRLVAVDMGVPKLGGGFTPEGKTHHPGEEIEVLGEGYHFFEVSLGNPHAVVFRDAVHQFPIERVGPVFESMPRFPRRTNVEFVEVQSTSDLRVRVWERGAGITLACGTGACAAAVTALAAGRVKGKVSVHLPGGTLAISWEGPGHPVIMEGPATEVFRGEFLI